MTMFEWSRCVARSPQARPGFNSQRSHRLAPSTAARPGGARSGHGRGQELRQGPRRSVAGGSRPERVPERVPQRLSADSVTWKRTARRSDRAFRCGRDGFTCRGKARRRTDRHGHGHSRAFPEVPLVALPGHSGSVPTLGCRDASPLMKVLQQLKAATVRDDVPTDVRWAMFWLFWAFYALSGLDVVLGGSGAPVRGWCFR